MSSRFNLVPRINMPRSKFDLSFEHKLGLMPGYLTPVCVQEVLPGDSFKVSQNSLLRFASSLITPLMDNLELKFEWFFVPNRLVWNNWERFMGQQDDPGDSIDYLIPSTTILAQGNQLRPDFYTYLLGFSEQKVGTSTAIRCDNVSLLPYRAYAKIYDDWYRDENLCDSAKVLLKKHWNDSAVADKVLGREDATVTLNEIINLNTRGHFNLFKRAKKHDYFTSCLPWPQKGPGVELPVGAASAPVFSSGEPVKMGWTGTNSGGNANLGILKLTSPDEPNYLYLGSNGVERINFGPKGTDSTGLYADLSSATAVTINSLRQAFQLQKFYERMARGGSRYTEIVRSFFGVVSPDARLQRSEYLGGCTIPITFQTVAQTSSTNETSPQANLASFGIAMDNSFAFQRSFTEHGYILGIASVMSKPSYSQGVPRYLTRRSREDFYWPTFAHLGEQAVLMKEIYAQSATLNDQVFGYQERYAEYRFNMDKLSGILSPSREHSLQSWTVSQKFSAEPKLNQSFIEENAPIERVVAVSEESNQHFLLDVFFKIDAVRVMPVYGVPGLVDHF